jgi:hypothetical protein
MESGSRGTAAVAEVTAALGTRELKLEVEGRSRMLYDLVSA